MQIPPQNYLVPNLIPYGLITLVGKSKIGKSWLCLQLALAVASEQHFLGEQVAQGDVLYLALEDVAVRLQERLEALGGLPGDWADHLTFWLHQSLNLDDLLADIKKWLQEAPNPRLVCIDVLGRILPHNTGRDEYQFYTHVFSKIQALSQEFGVAIVLVHHAKKGLSQSSDPYDQILGSTAIMSNSDATLLLERGRLDQQGLLHVTGRDIEERQVNLRRVGVKWEAGADSVEPALSSARQKVIDAIQAGAASPTEIAERSGRDRSAVQQLLKALVNDGLVIKLDRGAYGLPGSVTPDITTIAHNQSQAWAMI